MKRIGAIALVLTASTLWADDVWKPTGALWLKLSKQGDVIDATSGPAWLIAPPIEGVPARLGIPIAPTIDIHSNVEVGPTPRVVSVDSEERAEPVAVPSRPRVIDVSLEKPSRIGDPGVPSAEPPERLPDLRNNYGPVQQKINPPQREFKKISPYNPIIHPTPTPVGPRIG